MQRGNVEIAEKYYKAMGEKNVPEMAKLLHPNVEFIGPLAEMRGKEPIVEAIKRITSIYNSLTVREKFSADDRVMVVYDLDCPAPLGNLRIAALLKINAGFIEKMELFYDARPFEKK